MGVNTLWLSSPVLGPKLCEEGPARTRELPLRVPLVLPIASGWTYGSDNDPLFTDNGVTNPIDPHFGVAADLVALVNAAHQHGIRVLTDLVVNHVFADPSPSSGTDPAARALWRLVTRRIGLVQHPLTAAESTIAATKTSGTPPKPDMEPRRLLVRSLLARPQHDQSRRVDDTHRRPRRLADGAVQPRRLPRRRREAGDQRPLRRRHSRSARPSPRTSRSHIVGEALGGVVANVMDLRRRRHVHGRWTTCSTTPSWAPSSRATPQARGLPTSVRWRARRRGVVDERDPGALMEHFFTCLRHPARHQPRQRLTTSGRPLDQRAARAGDQPDRVQRACPGARVPAHLRLLPHRRMGDEFGQPGAIIPTAAGMTRFDTALSSLDTTTLTNFQKLGMARARIRAAAGGAHRRLTAPSTPTAAPAATDFAVVANLGSAAATRTMNVGNIGPTRHGHRRALRHAAHRRSRRRLRQLAHHHAELRSPPPSSRSNLDRCAGAC